MELISSFVRVSIPNYLAGLPIPDSLSGWFKLGLRDWISLAPLAGVVAGISYLAYDKIQGGGLCKSNKGTHVNLAIKKNEAKVVDQIDVEDIGDKKVFCRCWRSSSFPYCDGTHAKHNKECGDNVGPLIIAKKSN
uniref:CDGSH iron-sulfur domain-containing protein 2 homologue n=1 Tax=Alona affinis TaxID=381656 RepID=A0A9N6ZF39_9CRUS|nr:EOG090X0JRY [Alona affinis]